MASIYFRKDSPFIWIKYKQDGKIVQESTKLRKKVPSDIRRSRAIAAEKTAAELRAGGSIRREGWAWVSDFLSATYGSGNALTYRSYVQSWRTIKVFLNAKDVAEPAYLRRRHCAEYISWRMAGAPGVRPAKQGTALGEIAVLRLVMDEACEREIVTGNPCLNLKIKRSAPKRKPELSAEQCALIRGEISKETDPFLREMLFYSFEITRYQGCRLMASRLNPQTDVEFTEFRKPDGQMARRGTIRLWNKGSEIKTILHPALFALFDSLKANGRTYTWRIPPGRGYTWASAAWWRFLKRIGLKDAGITPHCNRVTAASELLRAGVPQRYAMELLGHRSEFIHQGYQRVRPEDLAESIQSVGKTLPDSLDTSSDAPASNRLPAERQITEPSEGSPTRS